MQKRFANSALGIFNYGDISIEINGRTDHSTYEIRQFAESLAELVSTGPSRSRPVRIA
jgi:hypothetical protein